MGSLLFGLLWFYASQGVHIFVHGDLHPRCVISHRCVSGFSLGSIMHHNPFWRGVKLTPLVLEWHYIWATHRLSRHLYAGIPCCSPSFIRPPFHILWQVSTLKTLPGSILATTSKGSGGGWLSFQQPQLPYWCSDNSFQCRLKWLPHIKTFGWWKFSTFTLYVWTSCQSLTTVYRALVTKSSWHCWFVLQHCVCVCVWFSILFHFIITIIYALW